MTTPRNNADDVKRVFERINEAIEHGQNVKDAAASAGVSAGFYYYWRSKLKSPGMSENRTAPAKLAEENRKLRRLLAEQVLENVVLRDKVDPNAMSSKSK